MIGIRQKLLLGFAGILLAVGVIGALTTMHIVQLGNAIDVILRENYKSVIACQDMKESVERIDSGLLSLLLEHEELGKDLIAQYTKTFKAALDVELNNITLPRERELSGEIAALFPEYEAIAARILDPTLSLENRQSLYFSSALPRFQQIKLLAQTILDMNQKNMQDASAAARAKALTARRQIVVAVLVCVGVAVGFGFFVQTWVLRPIHALMRSTDEIKRGHFELVVPVASQDEIGRLSESFNEMAATLRAMRRAEQIELARTREGAKNVFKALPATVATVDLEGRIEMSTEPAVNYFGMRPGVNVKDLEEFPWLAPLVERALSEHRVVEYSEGSVQRFIDNEEHFFQPVIMPIPVGPNVGELTGAAIMLRDVTLTQEKRELTQNAVATVSHQIKTPLTALRMSVHLLLNETVGGLNEKQLELLIAAREESDRLTRIVDDLLDLSRIESGGGGIDVQPQSPHTLVHNALEGFMADAADKGVTLSNNTDASLPRVAADAKRIEHVFSNVLSNALRYTPPGGAIRVDADAAGGQVKFSIVDSGTGMAPGEAARVFEPFYRAPGQQSAGGAGLGLTIAKQIVEAHGGSAGVESKPEQGTTVWFTLPIADDEQRGVEMKE